MVMYPTGFNEHNVNDRFIWGGSINKMQWLPMPSTGLTANKTFDDNPIALENGGAQSIRSGGYHSEFDMSWAVREAQGAGGLDLYAKYAAGYYYPAPSYGGGGSGSGDPNVTKYFYFANPMNFGSNLMAPQWATPMLCGQSAFMTGFRPIGNIIQWEGTPANDYDQPSNATVFDTSEGGIADLRSETSQSLVIPIPPTHDLYLGFSGTVTGAGAIGLSYHRVSDDTMVTTRITSLLDPLASTRIAPAVSGSVADYAVIFLSSTGTYGTPGTVSLTSSMAQLWPSTIVANPNGGQDGRHIFGEGNTGLAFTDSAMAETYVQVVNGEDRHYKGLSTKLLEVEAWA